MGGLLRVGGPSWELVVFQQWSEHVRKCAYTMATHAGSTVLWSVAVLQCLGRLQIKHKITYMQPDGDSSVWRMSQSSKDFASLGYLLLVCVYNLFLFVPWVFSIILGDKGKAIKSVTVNPSREIRDAFGLSLQSGNFHVYSLHHWLLCSAISWQTVM